VLKHKIQDNKNVVNVTWGVWISFLCTLPGFSESQLKFVGIQDKLVRSMCNVCHSLNGIAQVAIAEMPLILTKQKNVVPPGSIACPETARTPYALTKLEAILMILRANG
jgi:hypothetical protein